MASTAAALEQAIEQARRLIGRPLTRVQYRLRRVSETRRPTADESIEYHRRMMSFGDYSTPPDVAKRLDQLRESVSA